MRFTDMKGWIGGLLLLGALCVAILCYLQVRHWSQQNLDTLFVEIVPILAAVAAAILFWASVQFIIIAMIDEDPLALVRWFGPDFEMRGWFATALFLGSLALAVVLYAAAQRLTQENLIQAYKEADVVSAFCNSHTAFAPSVCEESDRMSWQQVHALLLAANVISRSEYETAADLMDVKPPEHLELLKALCNHQSGDCSGRRQATSTNWYVGEDVERGGKSETALELVYRLSTAQCVSENIGESPEERARKVTDAMAHALADAVGGPDLRLIRKLGRDLPVNRCEHARDWLANLGQDDNDPRMSGWRFSTAQCLSDSELLTALAVMSKAVVSSYNMTDGERQPVGYNLSGTCGNREAAEGPSARSRMLKQFEGFTKTNQYLLGVTHTLPAVRAAQKWANLVRGSEHVGILTLCVFTLITLLLRTGVFCWHGSVPERRQGLTDDLKKGGEVADRRLDSVARGRTLVRWAVATVPAIGFIGTVRGIMTALAGAGDVVWAGDRLERADAIGQLAGELGLAFSTTLFALLVGVLLGWVNAVTRAYEERLLERTRG